MAQGDVDAVRAGPPAEAVGSYESAVELARQMDPSTRGRAVRLLEDAIAIDPDFPEALGLLAFLHLATPPASMLTTLEWPQLDSAEAMVARAVELAPNRPMVLAARGLVDAARGDAPSDYHQRILESDVTGMARGMAAIVHGMGLRNTGSLGRAVAAFEAGLGHYPLYRQSAWGQTIELARLDPAMGLRRFGDIRLSLARLGFAPFDRYGAITAGFFGNMAWVALAAEEFDQAKILADSAIMVERKEVFRAIPGDIALFERRFSDAATHFQAAIDEPRRGGQYNTWGRSVRTNLGVALMRSGRNDEGRRILEAEWERNQAHPPSGWVGFLERAGFHNPVIDVAMQVTFRAIDNAAIQANLGNVDQAIGILTSADPKFLSRLALILPRDPWFDPLADDDRFLELLQRLDAIRQDELSALDRERERLGSPLCDPALELVRSWESRPC